VGKSNMKKDMSRAKYNEDSIGLSMN